MKRITLFITAMTQGGAERQLSMLGKLFVERGHEVSLVTYVDAPDHYTIDERITRIRIAEGKSKFVKLFHILKYFMTVQSDVVISFEERNNFLALIGLIRRTDIKVIASERNFMINNSKLMSALRKILYKKADVIVPNSHAQGEFLMSLSNSIRRKVSVITNYTDISVFQPIISDRGGVILITVFVSSLDMICKKIIENWRRPYLDLKMKTA